jgi:pimeloyl-ACP methyl ester carboxylesterase
MSAIIIEGDLVHYEVMGRGKPIVLIHGWLGSWRYWLQTMQQLGVKYRCYALDLWGFGDSGKDPHRYDFHRQLQLLDQFMERMGFPKVILVGHGLGAALAAHYAANPTTGSKVHRMFLVCPPLFYEAPTSRPQALPLTSNTAPGQSSSGQVRASTLPATRPSLNPLQSSATASPQSVQMGDVLRKIFEGASPESLLAKATDSTHPDYDKLRALITKTDAQAILRSAQAFNQISTFRDILQTAAPTMVMLGENDGLLPYPDENVLTQLAERPALKLLVTASKHFPMIEDRTQFLRIVKDFIEAPDVTKLELTEEWVRRKR